MSISCPYYTAYARKRQPYILHKKSALYLGETQKVAEIAVQGLDKNMGQPYTVATMTPKHTTTTTQEDDTMYETIFNTCKTLDELKKAYKAAAMKHHPDVGGSTVAMQQINAAYERKFEYLKGRQNTEAAADTTGKTHATTESAGDFVAIIDALLRLDGLEIELCGRWLWIGGNTRQHKEALKAAGCRWSSTKKLWSWHFAEDGVYHRGKSKSMDQIRSKYGSTSFSRSTNSDALPA